MSEKELSLEKELKEKIYDNVHGFISLTEEEKELLSTPFFQRLNHIKQLGLTYSVFPGAVHTRFSHSLGVLHITEKIIQRIKLIYPEDNPFNNTIIHKVTRLAALLHDIGHYPLSHTIEKSYLEVFTHKQREQKQAESTPPSNALGEDIPLASPLEEYCTSSNIQKFLKYYEPNKKNEYHHESMARIVINNSYLKSILMESFELEQTDIDDICNLIDGTMVKGKYFIPAQIIHSFLDADNMDYMMRDTINTGINASIDLDFIISNIKLCEKETEIGEGETVKSRISHKLSSIQSIEQFILSKYYWYSSILYFDKAYILNSIAQRIYSYLLLNDKIDKEFGTIAGLKEILSKNPEEFFFFNDDYFWSKIKQILNEESKNSLIYKLAKMLTERKFPEVKKQAFFDEKFPGQSTIINPHNTIELLDKLEHQKNIFEKVIEQEENLVGIMLNKEIIPIKDDSKPAFEDIYIKTSRLECESLSNFSKFFDLFIDKNSHESKCFIAFRVYDFEKILSSGN